MPRTIQESDVVVLNMEQEFENSQKHVVSFFLRLQQTLQ